MGWVADVDGHEGWVASVAPDGQTSSASNGLGILLSRPDEERVKAAWASNRTPTTDDMYELVPYADVVGWQVKCECGWAGRRWAREEAIQVGRFVDADDSYLSDGRTVEDHGLELWSAHVEPLGRLAAVREAAEAVAVARDALDTAVQQARTQDPALSWAEIGQAARMTRQSAHERWGPTSG